MLMHSGIFDEDACTMWLKFDYNDLLYVNVDSIHFERNDIDTHSKHVTAQFYSFYVKLKQNFIITSHITRKR